MSLYAKGMLTEKELESFIKELDGKIKCFNNEAKSLKTIIEKQKMTGEKMII